MRELEERIRRAALTESPNALDEKVDTLISAAERAAPTRSIIRVPLWAAAVACLVCAIVAGSLGYGFRQPAVQPPSPTVVIIEATPELEEWLEHAIRNDQTRAQERQYRSLHPIYIAGSKQQQEADHTGRDL